MKTNTTFKEFIAIVKSGIVGALALTGLCIILFLIGLTVRMPLVSYLYSKTFAKCSLEGLFIATGSIGFIFGLIVRRHFPIIQRGIAPIAVAAIPLIIGAWFVNAIAIRVSIPEKVKLADCTNSTTIIHLKVPKGHNYYLELVMPDVQREPNGDSVSTYKFSGGIRVSNKISLIADFPISSEKALLEPSGFILTGGGIDNTNGPILSQLIQAQKDYDVQITLDPPPPPSTSLWLHWMQARIDLEK